MSQVTAATCAARTCCSPPSKKRKHQGRDRRSPIALPSPSARASRSRPPRTAWPRCCAPHRAACSGSSAARAATLADRGQPLDRSARGRPLPSSAARRHRRQRPRAEPASAGLEVRDLRRQNSARLPATPFGLSSSKPCSSSPLGNSASTSSGRTENRKIPSRRSRFPARSSPSPTRPASSIWARRSPPGGRARLHRRHRRRRCAMPGWRFATSPILPAFRR
jgi:hypothetical protein